MNDDQIDPSQRVYRYSEADYRPSESLSHGDPAIIDALTAHVERHVGPIGMVYHELVSPHVHVDVHHVAPTDERPWHVLFTTGMSERPMTVPAGAEEFRFAELMVCLPAEWPVSQEAFADERNYWPVQWLKALARFPHEYGSWLGFGHTIPNGDPPAPVAPGTSLCGMLLLPPGGMPEEAWTCRVDAERTVHLWSLMPIHADEMKYKLRHGTDDLLEKFEAADVSFVVDAGRPSALAGAKRRWWPFS